MVAIINKQSLSDGSIAVTFRANGDPVSDSTSTLYVTAATTATDVQAWIAAEQARVAAQYDAMQAVHSALAAISI